MKNKQAKYKTSKQRVTMTAEIAKEQLYRIVHRPSHSSNAATAFQ